ncbi:hypothetical protein IFR05_011373 [Cadophora sp. M221]|nr:hypothetical protein IFR05_011373 [Cadophora sp. M221]
MDPSTNPDMNNAQKTLLSTGQYSDLVLQCKDRKFSVHCAVVCMRSDVIANKVERWSHGRVSDVQHG